MKTSIKQISYKAMLASFMMLVFNIVSFAQNDKVVIDTGEAKSWISENWMWLVGGLLLLILLFSLGSSRTRKTTVTRDYPTGTSTTTTTTIED